MRQSNVIFLFLGLNVEAENQILNGFYRWSIQTNSTVALYDEFSSILIPQSLNLSD